ncbi:uncharacterized protein LOC111045284 isoform X2 [Nilaparvata lugens]|nr:uncharacterized protein LOC111045284 isoform X2 [Nilaparvata lugens]XP_039284635.1 uncharacterized protein LOC111045284 isoform X2 [Nilaparvata lugens]XP_039284636.1 uncharacterized protein LOC111045284 isoform X2 [Nilaparvata lugens]
MAGRVWILFLLAISLPDKLLAITKVNVTESTSTASRIVNPIPSQVLIPQPTQYQCTSRMESALSSMSARKSSSGHTSTLELAGYALHQPLKAAPYDMYVTDMRIKIPGRTHNWAKVDRCRFDPSLHTLQSRMVFRDLAVTGMVKLYDEAAPLKRPSAPITDKCRMTIRLRRAGVGFTTVPRRSRNGVLAVTTTATFLEPQFVSVHAYSCDAPENSNKRTTDGPEARDSSADGENDLGQEMEQVFLKGIRSLITNYMEKQMEQALRDTLMTNLGYSVSYGR